MAQKSFQSHRKGAFDDITHWQIFL